MGISAISVCRTMSNATHQPDRISAPFGHQGRRAEDFVERSWRRAAHVHHIDPDAAHTPHVLTVEELRPLREAAAQLIEGAQPELDHLYTLIRPLKYIVLLADTNGVVVDYRGEHAENTRFRYWGSWLGGVWDEATEGTNGIGTSIAELRPVTIHKGQHFRARYTDLSCSGAPVFDDNDALLGVVCLTSIDPHLSEHAHAMAGALATTSARAIEERLFREKFRRHWVLAIRDPGTSAGILLALDRDRRIVGADRAGRTHLAAYDQRLDDSPSLWSVFERDKTIIWPKDQNDSAISLRPLGNDVAWAAMITPPLVFAARALTQEVNAFQTRSRLGCFLTGRPPAELPPAPQATRGGLPPALINRLRGYIDSHLDQNIDLRALAAEAQLSTYHFARAFKQAEGITPHRFILERRLARARELLRQRNLALSEIAMAVGFADQSHFTRRFRDREGISPGQFRKLHGDRSAAAA
jgi:AraC-like DNA-binding protein